MSRAWACLLGMAATAAAGHHSTQVTPASIALMWQRSLATQLIMSQQTVSGNTRRCFLITLWSSTAACHAMGSWFARVLHTVSHALNIAILSGEVGQPTPERLPQPMGARKRRRLDPELRNSFKAAVAEKRARNAQWHARGGGLELPSRTAGSLGETLAADYYWSSFKLLTGCDQLSVCLDASSVGGEDTMVLAAWSWQAGKGCWLVPQAA